MIIAERSVSKVTPSLTSIHGQVTKHTTVKWPIQTRFSTAATVLCISEKNSLPVSVVLSKIISEPSSKYQNNCSRKEWIE